MKTYYIFSKDSMDVDDLYCLQDGFSCSAFFFTVIWSLYHKLWLVSSVIFVFLGVLSYLVSKSLVITEVLVLSKIAIVFFYGLNGSYLIERKLIRQGFSLVGIVRATEKFYAMEKYYNGDCASIENNVNHQDDKAI
ncbi:MAG: hypothetical protein P857_93 [Candidatus Xenolissoclinum pacificiensis L6]|uniref:DUF2628 domain-containing protein n=1 Tax=Candidatus Xenolissoclinum pacificiensis L6 TaxID=1401685 RepID=W2V0M7_9RICK|nr:MAG: hypothetical protein P857_93 [Candidatus Xenolissoclinum pacificiensis L6]